METPAVSASASGKAKLWRVAKTIKFIKQRTSQIRSDPANVSSPVERKSLQESVKNINVSVLDLVSKRWVPSEGAP